MKTIKNVIFDVYEIENFVTLAIFNCSAHKIKDFVAVKIVDFYMPQTLVFEGSEKFYFSHSCKKFSIFYG